MRAPSDGASIARLAALLADPTRAGMCLALLDGTRLTDEERERLRVVAGPPPLELERALWRLGSPTRPPGHLERLRRLGDDYTRAVDGDEDALRWLEAALGHRPATLTRCDLLGQDGLPLRLPP